MQIDDITGVENVPGTFSRHLGNFAIVGGEAGRAYLHSNPDLLIVEFGNKKYSVPMPTVVGDVVKELQKRGGEHNG